ncbi:MAG: hypothetical protein ABJM43_02285 [Paracoccaceae bacterium]
MDQITKTLMEFFEGTAQAFTDGQFERAAKSWEIPNTVHAGEHKLFLSSYKDLENILTVYRRNLAVEDYARTSVEVLQCIKDKSGVVQALVHWTNFNTKGAEINTLDASYFCRLGADFRWHIETIELVSHPSARFSDGMPFYRLGK